MAASQSTMDKLYGMRLSVMAQAYRDLEEMPGTADMSFDERFAMIVDAEWDARRVNKRTRLLRQAGFPEPEANVADVRYDADRKLDKAKIAELSNCEWIRNHRNVLLTGASGAGKSWIASALGVAPCKVVSAVHIRVVAATVPVRYDYYSTRIAACAVQIPSKLLPFIRGDLVLFALQPVEVFNM